MVPTRGLEPPRPLKGSTDFKSVASTNSATWAFKDLNNKLGGVT